MTWINYDEDTMGRGYIMTENEKRKENQESPTGPSHLWTCLLEGHKYPHPASSSKKEAAAHDKSGKHGQGENPI